MAGKSIREEGGGEICLDDADLTEGPLFDSRMIQLVTALTGCEAHEAEEALAKTTQLADADPMAWSSRAIVHLRRNA